MKYVLKNTCGHVVAYDIFGTYERRERTVAWLRSQPCPKCRAEAKRREEAQAREAQIEQYVQTLLAALEADPNPEGAIQMLSRQLAAGQGTELKREAVRRAIAAWRQRQQER